jgi:hypothetical protein
MSTAASTKTVASARFQELVGRFGRGLANSAQNRKNVVIKNGFLQQGTLPA